MATGARIAMRTERPADPVLTLSQWFSPAFPVGAFAYSHGLEWAIEAGDVVDAAGLSDWVRAVVEHGSGRNDAVLIAAAFAVEDPAPVAAIARAFAPSRERLAEADLQGAAFASIINEVWGLDLPPLPYAVAVGHGARLCDLPLEMTAQMYLQAFVSTLVSVGMRLVPLGQSDGHRIIAKLTPLCAQLARAAAHGDLETLQATTFLPDIASMKHETQYARVFRT